MTTGTTDQPDDMMNTATDDALADCLLHSTSVQETASPPPTDLLLPKSEIPHWLLPGDPTKSPATLPSDAHNDCLDPIHDYNDAPNGHEEDHEHQQQEEHYHQQQHYMHTTNKDLMDDMDDMVTEIDSDTPSSTHATVMSTLSRWKPTAWSFRRDSSTALDHYNTPQQQQPDTHCDVDNCTATTASSSSSSSSLLRQVRFQNETDICYIPSRTDLYHDTFLQVFYSRQDYRYMRTYSLLLAERLEELGRLCDTRQDAFRGLEGLTRAGAQAREDRKQRSRTTVLCEQERQRLLCCTTQRPEMVAALYADTTIVARDLAVARGIRDAMAVREMVEESGEWLDAELDLTGILTDTNKSAGKMGCSPQALAATVSDTTAASRWPGLMNLVVGGWRRPAACVEETSPELRI